MPNVFRFTRSQSYRWLWGASLSKRVRNLDCFYFFQFIKNPLIVDQSKTQDLPKQYFTDDIQGKNELIDGMWRRLIHDHSCLVLVKLIPKILCMFGSTYKCEATFSSLVRQKPKYRPKQAQNCDVSFVLFNPISEI